MSLETAILSWSALALVLAISPGPDTLLVTGHAAKGGVRSGLAAAAGISVGGIWYMLLCGLGFLSILSASPILFQTVKIAGVLYLAWIGVKMIKGALKPQNDMAINAVTLSAPFRQGLLTNVINPKIAVFYLAALPQFTGNGSDAPMIGAILVAIHYAIGALWLSILALGVGQLGKTVRKSSGFRAGLRWLDGILGAAFVGLAGRLALVRSS